MRRTQATFAFALAAILLSQTGCCCCVTIPVGPQPGEEGEFPFEPLAPVDPAFERESAEELDPNPTTLPSGAAPQEEP